MELAFESRMLIDGALVEAQGARTYDNVNPATESVIGPVADASTADMERAVAAARRSFDEMAQAHRERLLGLHDHLRRAIGRSVVDDNHLVIRCERLPR